MDVVDVNFLQCVFVEITPFVGVVDVNFIQCVFVEVTLFVDVVDVNSLQCVCFKMTLGSKLFLSEPLNKYELE